MTRYKLISVSLFILLLNCVSFSCSPEEMPTNINGIQTNPVSDVTLTSLVTGGSISALDDTQIDSRGVVWSRTSMPTIANTTWRTKDGIGGGLFQSELKGLSLGTYYIRAYVVSSNTEYYGNEVVFDYSPLVPKIVSQLAIYLSANSAKVQTKVEYTWTDPIIEKGLCLGASKLPTVDNDTKLVDTNTSLEFTTTLSSLTSGVTYYTRSYVITKLGVFYGNSIQVLILPPPSFSQVQDIDGNIYKTVVIGSQTWMAENLMVTKYQDGTLIPSLLSESEFKNTKEGAYTSYGGNSSNVSTFGYLYNGYVMTINKNLCMAGWHIPTSSEWNQLANALGGKETAGGRMKAVSTSWVNPNTSATNESGFAGLPGGSYCSICLSNTGVFADMGTDGYWWSSKPGDFFYLTNDLQELRTKNTAGKNDGMSIRCIKD